MVLIRPNQHETIKLRNALVLAEILNLFLSKIRKFFFIFKIFFFFFFLSTAYQLNCDSVSFGLYRDVWEAAVVDSGQTLCWKPALHIECGRGQRSVQQ